MDLVTQDITMQAALSHAVQSVHEAQDLKPPTPPTQQDPHVERGPLGMGYP